ncbi:7412_t:CDS:2 [Funneliformis geosporum]|nr:7412_t:CDS:2 [Funneliformis geosporum]
MSSKQDTYAYSIQHDPLLKSPRPYTNTSYYPYYQVHTQNNCGSLNQVTGLLDIYSTTPNNYPILPLLNSPEAAASATIAPSQLYPNQVTGLLDIYSTTPNNYPIFPLLNSPEAAASATIAPSQFYPNQAQLYPNQAGESSQLDEGCEVTKKNKPWNESAITSFLSFLKENKKKVQQLKSRGKTAKNVKGTLWQDASIKLRTINYHYTRDQCEIKWKNILRDHKTKKNFKYKSEVEKILRKD